MNEITLTPEMRLQELFARWPETMPVFVKRRMICVGCSMAAFDTLEEAVRNYGLNWNLFVDDLQASIQAHETPAL